MKGFMLPVSNLPQTDSLSAKKLRNAVLDCRGLKTDHWASVTNGTLTLKQAFKAKIGNSLEHSWAWGDEHQYRDAFHHFMKLLNRDIFGKAADRHGKRLGNPYSREGYRWTLALSHRRRASSTFDSRRVRTLHL
jgi:hypothetical protein